MDPADPLIGVSRHSPWLPPCAISSHVRTTNVVCLFRQVYYSCNGWGSKIEMAEMSIRRGLHAPQMPLAIQDRNNISTHTIAPNLLLPNEQRPPGLNRTGVANDSWRWTCVTARCISDTVAHYAPNYLYGEAPEGALLFLKGFIAPKCMSPVDPKYT